ncbi:hypothetical protein NPX13_g7109 [Xylaria arbuscula]|uniref:DUF6594 domain-containing protein n=1 Tax=Xylaria arbuscula TaxID=114810 RepID=A0A9W8NAZ1_9PEZI|nr:hypothetical protein NPX13_g7109 [Xylaria arbuscula]
MELQHALSTAFDMWFYPGALAFAPIKALIIKAVTHKVFRRFSTLRTRLLLLKQDKLSILERKLERIDQTENNMLRLGSNRSDDNAERGVLLSEINNALIDYDELIERSHRILNLAPAKQRSVSSLQHWINGNGCVARDEAAYLGCTKELASVTETDDTVMSWLETLVEDCLIRTRGYFRRQDHFAVSRDPNVHIPTRSSIARLAQMLMTPVIIMLLLAPVLICSMVISLAAQIGTIVVATTIFVAVVSSSTKAKAIELVVAGATYTTVLTVFISGANTSYS